MNRERVIGLLALGGITAGFAYLFIRKELEQRQEVLQDEIDNSNILAQSLNRGVSFTRIGNFSQNARFITYTIDGNLFTVSIADIADMPYKFLRGRQLDLGEGSTRHKIERDGSIYAIKADNDNDFLFDI